MGEMTGRILAGIAAATMSLGIGLAPGAHADDVPGIDDDAELGEECDSFDRYIFGRGPEGEPLACVAYGDDEEGQWVTSVPLVGVRMIGSPCIGDDAAQSPNGRALVCVVGAGWQPVPN